MLLNSKSYRYLSPVYDVDRLSNNVLRIDSVGFVNRPNLLSGVLNSQTQDIQEQIEQIKQQIEDIKKLSKR